MYLTDHLYACAELWAETSGKSVARLSTIVVNDGKFFPRLGQGRLGVTTATLEKFAEFFADAGSWPEGGIPAEVGEFIHRVAGISPDTAVSSDHGAALIGAGPCEAGVRHVSGVVDYPTASLLEGGESCPTVPLFKGGVFPMGVGVPGVVLVKVGGVSLPVICPECDLRIDDARVLQCRRAICPRRIAA